MQTNQKGVAVVKESGNGEGIVRAAPAKRRRWTARRKRDVVLEGVKGSVAIVELCRREGISQSMYYEWKEAALTKMEEALAYGGRTKEEYEKDREIARLQRKIGEQAMDIEILKKVREARVRREKFSGNFGKGGSL